MKYIKKYYKTIIFIVIAFFLLFIKFPYYVNTSGGILDLSSRVNINGYGSKGSINLVYVKEYRANIPLVILAWISKDYDIHKADDVLFDEENYKDYDIRDNILMDESISNAIFVAYNYADKKIVTNKTSIKVILISKEANTDLKVGDEIININGTNVSSKSDIEKILSKLKSNDKLTITTMDNLGKMYTKYAFITKEGKIGIGISEISDYDLNPSMKIARKKNESGSSGGLAFALQIYNSLVENDITNGKTIVCTGTIRKDGTIGSIGGVEYKLKSAVKNKADLFIVPNGENYDSAIKYKNKNNYNIKIIGVSTFYEVVTYLKQSA